MNLKMTIVNLCSGCNKTINDLYYLVVGSKFYWHLSCLHCRSCGISLQTHSKCYMINGSFYCSDDYFKIKEHKLIQNDCFLINNNNENECLTSNCKKCKTQIKANDYVIRLNDIHANDFLFHTNCFVCFKCNVQISPGHQYGLINGNVFCSTHYFIEKIDYIHNNQERPNSEEQSGSNLQIQIISRRENVNNDFEQLNKTNERIEDEQLVTLLNSNLQYNNSNQPVDLEINNSKRSNSKSNSSGNVMVNSNSTHNNSSHGKKKRIRTSFKHQQLRIMKAHFQINQNPDSKDLKELSERTGLQKRVLQVWFQNSRAKQRKSCSSSTSGSFNQIVSNSMIIDDKQQSNDSSLIMEEEEHDQEGDDDVDNEDSNCVSEDLNDENDNNNNIAFQSEQEMKKYHQLHHLPSHHHHHHHHHLQINKFNQETEFQQQFQPLVDYYRSY